MERVWEFFKAVVQNPKTSATGVALVAAGVSMLKTASLDAVAPGVTAVLTGLGFILSADGKRKTD